MPSPVRRLSLVVLALALGPAARGEPPARTDLYGDPLPPGAVVRLGTVRWRSARFVDQMAFAPDGKHLATSCSALSVWDLASGRVVRTVSTDGTPQGEGFTHGFTFSRDGKYLLSAEEMGSPTPRGWGAGRKAVLLLWDFSSGKLLAQSPDLEGQTHSPALRSDGRLAACVDRRGVLLWRPGEKAFRTLTRCGNGEAVSVAFSPDGKQLLVVSFSSASGPRCWWVDVASGRLLKWVTLRSDNWALFSPDGMAGASCLPGQLYLHDTNTGAKRRLPLKEKRDYSGLSFNPHGRVLLAWDHWAETVHFWDVTEGRLLRRLRLPGLSRVDEHAPLLLSPDGTTLASSERRHVVRLWDALTGRPRMRPPGHVQPPYQVAFSPDGRELASYTLAPFPLGEVYRWQATTGKRLAHIALAPPDDGVPIEGFHWRLAPGGRHLAVQLSKDLHLYETRTGKRLDLPGLIPRGADWSFTPEGRSLVTTGPGRAVRLWDVTTGKLQRRLELEKKGGPIAWLRFSPDGRTIATGEGWRNVSLWDATTGKHRATLPLPADREPFQKPLDRWEVAFTPDGHYLFTSNTTNLWAWDLVARREAGPFESDEYNGSVGGSGQVAVSPDGRLLAWFDEAWKLRLYEICTGRIVHRFAEDYSSVAFAPSGWRLATGCDADSSVLVWDLPLLFRSQVPDKDARPELLWGLMAGDDAAEAHRALWRLAALPDADAFLTRRLTEVERVPPERLRALLADLGSPDFDKRKAAEEALAAAGEAARAALAEAAAGAKDPEVRRRLARLRARLRPPEARRLRELRAVLVLEARGTPEARRLLEALARGAPESRLTQEALAALRRWRPGREPARP